MQAIFYHPSASFLKWQAAFNKALPTLTVHDHQEIEHRCDPLSIDYAFVWAPPLDMLKQYSNLKAVFVLGAGVDAILDESAKHPDYLPALVPLFRIEDGGMAQQMIEYSLARVYHYFRRFDDYDRLKKMSLWQPLDAYSYADFQIGILGAGILGRAVATALAEQGFIVKTYSRSPHEIMGVTSFYSEENLSSFLSNTRVLINLLPSTPETRGIIDAKLLSQLDKGGYVINLARGAHLNEADLLELLDNGQISGASLDVFQQEPLDKEHPLWAHDKVFITPHIAAKSLIESTVEQIVSNITALRENKAVTGLVDRLMGY